MLRTLLSLLHGCHPQQYIEAMDCCLSTRTLCRHGYWRVRVIGDGVMTRADRPAGLVLPWLAMQDRRVLGCRIDDETTRAQGRPCPRRAELHDRAWRNSVCQNRLRSVAPLVAMMESVHTRQTYYPGARRRSLHNSPPLGRLPTERSMRAIIVIITDELVAESAQVVLAEHTDVVEQLPAA